MIDILKGLGKALGEAAKATAKTGAGIVVGALGGPQGSADFSNPDPNAFAAAAPKIPERSPIVNTRPNADAEKSVREPLLETGTFKFEKIKGTNIVKTLDNIHSSIISYLNTVNRNTVATFNYVRDMSKKQDARINVITTDVKMLRKGYDVLDRRMGRVERRIDQLEMRKPGTPWPEQHGGQYNPMSIGDPQGGGMGLKDAAKWGLGGAGAGAAAGFFAKSVLPGAMALGMGYLGGKATNWMLRGLGYNEGNPLFPNLGTLNPMELGRRYGEQHREWMINQWNAIPGNLGMDPSIAPKVGRVLDQGLLHAIPGGGLMSLGYKGYQHLWGRKPSTQPSELDKLSEGLGTTPFGQQLPQQKYEDARATTESLEIKRADIIFDATTDIKLTAVRDIALKGYKISLDADTIDLKARTISINGVTTDNDATKGDRQSSSHAKDADRGGGRTLIGPPADSFSDRWNLPSAPTPTIPRGGGGSDAPGQTQTGGKPDMSGKIMAIMTGLGNQIDKNAIMKYAQGKGMVPHFIDAAGGTGPNSPQVQAATQFLQSNMGKVGEVLGWSRGGYNLRHLPQELLSAIPNITALGAPNMDTSQFQGMPGFKFDPQHDNVIAKLAANIPNLGTTVSVRGSSRDTHWGFGNQQGRPAGLGPGGQDFGKFNLGGIQQPQQQTGPYRSAEHRIQSGSLGIHPELFHIIKEASKSLPEGYYARIESGKEARSRGGQHPLGNAGDVRIYGPDGKPVGGQGAWYQDPKHFRMYEEMAQEAKRVQMRDFPDSPGFAWGGYFLNQGPGSYGFADSMHFQRGGPMAGGNWEQGATGVLRKWLEQGGGTSLGIGDTQTTRVAASNVFQPTPGTQGYPFINVGNRANAPQPSQSQQGQTGWYDRSRYQQELANNPSLMERWGHMVKGEIGHLGDDPKSWIQAETALARSQVRGHTLEQGLWSTMTHGNRGYYPAATFAGRNQPTPEEMKFFKETMAPKLLAGYSPSEEHFGWLATGNASAGVAERGKAGGRYTHWQDISRETYAQHSHDTVFMNQNPDRMRRLTQPPGQQTPTQRELVGYKYSAKGEYSQYMTGTPVPFGMYNYAEQRLLDSMRHIKPDDDKTKSILERAQESKAMAGFRQSGAMNIQTLMDEVKPTDKEWAQFQKGGMGQYLSREGVYRDVPAAAAQQQQKLKQWQPDVPYNYQGDYKNIYGNTDFQGGLVPNVPSPAANAPIQSQTSRQYGERTLNLQHGESQEYIRAQMKRSKSAGWGSWEADNMDTKSDAEMEQVFRIAKEEGVGVILKNPTSDQIKKFGPRSAGAVYEVGSGKNPSQVEADRKAAKVDNLPVSFVGYGDGQRNTMNNVADQIAANKFANMSAQWGEGSKGREYRNTQVLPGGMGYGPATGLQQVPPTPTQTQLQKVQGAPFSTPESRRSWSQMPGMTSPTGQAEAERWGATPTMAYSGATQAPMGTTAPVGGATFAERSGMAGIPGFGRREPGSAMLDLGRLIPPFGAAMDIYKGISGLLTPKSPVAPSTDANVEAMRAKASQQAIDANVAAQAGAEAESKPLPVEDWTKGLGEMDGPPTDAQPSPPKTMTAEAPTDAIQKEASGAASAVPEPSPPKGEASVSAPDAVMKEGGGKAGGDFTAESVNPESFTGWPKDKGGEGPTEREENKPIGGRQRDNPEPRGSRRGDPGGSLRPPVHNPESESPKPGDNGYGTGRRDPDGLGLCTI